jgi:hypothetical protein
MHMNSQIQAPTSLTHEKSQRYPLDKRLEDRGIDQDVATIINT